MIGFGVLAGTKTQTRRAVKYAAPDLVDADGWPLRDESINGAGEVMMTLADATGSVREVRQSFYSSLRLLRPEWSQALHLHLRREGVLMMPSGFGRLYLSFAHDAEAMALLGQAFASAARAMRDDAAA